MLRSFQSLYFLLVILALGSLGPLLYLHQAWLEESRSFAEVTAHLSMIREETAEAHLWAEELITGDTTEDVAEVTRHFVVARDETAKFASDLVAKIPELQNQFVEGHSITEHARLLKEDLVVLELKANSRLADRAVSGAGSASDISFDAIYRRALDRTRMLEQNIRHEQSLVVQEHLRDHRITLIVWAGTLLGTLLFMLFIRSRQRKAEAETRMLEARFQEAQKLESLGVLAGGIAHDFNNLLQSVSGNTSLLLHDETLPDEIRDQVQEIESGAQKASELTSQMLSYAGKGRLSESVLPFDQIVDEIRSLVRLSTSKTVLVEYDLNTPGSCIRCNQTQIQQVVMNLVINAAEASVDDPHPVQVSTYVQEFSTADLMSYSIGLDEREPGEYIVFEVKDQGSGMDPETLRRCFEPFFSTKFTGRGLGLAAVLGIVRAHQGVLKVASSVGQGSIFQVLIPVCEEQPEISKDDEGLGEIDGAGRRVLVVDDDEMVCSILKRMLGRLGYAVESASDGLEGIQRLEKCCVQCEADFCSVDGCRQAIKDGYLYHAVVLDMEMPGRTGLDVGEEIRSRWAGLPLILSSGYGSEVIREESPFDSFLQKPYSLKKLAQTIAETAVPSNDEPS